MLLNEFDSHRFDSVILASIQGDLINGCNLGNDLYNDLFNHLYFEMFKLFNHHWSEKHPTNIMIFNHFIQDLYNDEFIPLFEDCVKYYFKEIRHDKFEFVSSN